MWKRFVVAAWGAKIWMWWETYRGAVHRKKNFKFNRKQYWKQSLRCFWQYFQYHVLCVCPMLKVMKELYYWRVMSDSYDEILIQNFHQSKYQISKHTNLCWQNCWMCLFHPNKMLNFQLNHRSPKAHICCTFINVFYYICMSQISNFSRNPKVSLKYLLWTELCSGSGSGSVPPGVWDLKSFSIPCFNEVKPNFIDES